MSYEILRSYEEYRGRNFTIRRVDASLPNGKVSSFDIVDHPGSVVLIPVDEQSNMLFVRQHRYPAGKQLLELPAGTRDGDEPYLECAAREIREETGMEAGKLLKVGEFYLAPGYSTEFMAVFLATELRENPLEADEDEFLEVERIPIKQAFEMAEKGEVPDAKSLAALLLARPYLNQYL